MSASRAMRARVRRDTGKSCGWLLLLCLITSAHADEPVTSGDYVRALSQTQAIDFRFRSDTQRYRCEEFAARIRAVLEPVTSAVHVQLECLGSSPSGYLHARVLVTSPVVATHEAIGRAAKVTPTRRLVARVRGEPAPDGRVEVFTAQWREVSTKRVGTAKLTPGDCELMRALRAQVLPHLAVRNLRVTSSCGRFTQPSVRAQVLIPADPDTDNLTRDAG
jgi:hypothetical protein